MKSSAPQTAALMGTIVRIEILGPGNRRLGPPERRAAIARAFSWFRQVEEACSRFDPQSELRRLSTRIGAPVQVSALLFEALQFALAVAEETGGAFDPTVGGRMAARGFNRNYRTGEADGAALLADPDATFRDVRLGPAHRTVTLLRPLVLDLGAVAKGLAIDLAAQELRAFRNFSINAGGDLYLGGRNRQRRLWSVGVRHPRAHDGLIETVQVSNLAVCTSGDYERRAPSPGDSHHLLDPRTGGSPTAVCSVTVLARSAMVADALATAAFVLGPTEGRRLLQRHRVEGLFITPALERLSTTGLRCA